MASLHLGLTVLPFKDPFQCWNYAVLCGWRCLKSWQHLAQLWLLLWRWGWDRREYGEGKVRRKRARRNSYFITHVGLCFTHFEYNWLCQLIWIGAACPPRSMGVSVGNGTDPDPAPTQLCNDVSHHPTLPTPNSDYQLRMFIFQDRFSDIVGVSCCYWNKWPQT